MLLLRFVRGKRSSNEWCMCAFIASSHRPIFIYLLCSDEVQLLSIAYRLIPYRNRILFDSTHTQCNCKWRGYFCCCNFNSNHRFYVMQTQTKVIFFMISWIFFVCLSKAQYIIHDIVSSCVVVLRLNSNKEQKRGTSTVSMVDKHKYQLETRVSV